jgi:hypothetical protein
VSWLGPRSVDGGIDRIPLPRRSGLLWLCGKHAVGPDVQTVLSRCGLTLVVCLNERHELDQVYPEYVRWLDDNRGGRSLWYPVPDLHAPALVEARPLLDDLVTRLDGGASILVHCGAGVGRAGTIAACLLITMGMERDAALRLVAAHRPLAGPEAGAQQELVEHLAAALAES